MTPPSAKTGYIIGAYVASPCLERWDAGQESAFYDGLKGMPAIRGLEHAFYGTLHRDDDRWFVDHVKPEWDHVFTCIPGAMDRLKENPSFGLASADDNGRRSAIEYHAAARAAVEKLNTHLGRRSVIAVQLHSAPTRTHISDSSATAFARSLTELAQWDWQGARLVIEHCDAFTTRHPAAKGFLTLEEELEAVAAVPAPARPGFTINWGRSAIEGRSVDTPLQHIERLRAAGALRGLIFSGAGTTDDAYGVWKDTHMPPANGGSRGSVLPAHSLMTTTEMRRCIAAAGTLDYVGAKVMLRPKDADVPARLQLIRETITLLDVASA